MSIRASGILSTTSRECYVAYNLDHEQRTLKALRKDEELNFDAMDAFITSILAILREQGGRAVRVFPPEAGVLIAFAERLTNEVVSMSLLHAVRTFT